MSAQWVKPGWPKADQHLAGWPQERVHNSQDFRRIGEMLKGVHRNDNVGKLVRGRYEETGALNARTERFLPCGLEHFLADVNANHAPGAPHRHLHGIGSFATTEVDDRLSGQPVEEFIPHQDRELRLAFHSAPATVLRGSGSDPLQNPALNVGEHIVEAA